MRKPTGVKARASQGRKASSNRATAADASQGLGQPTTALAKAVGWAEKQT
ncbi:MAG: hypothetical protein AAGG53_08265 [Cyanobacteria bacterium P01_H01_bin.152]